MVAQSIYVGQNKMYVACGLQNLCGFQNHSQGICEGGSCVLLLSFAVLC